MKRLLSCDKVLPGCAWLVLSKTGPFFCTSLYCNTQICVAFIHTIHYLPQQFQSLPTPVHLVAVHATAVVVTGVVVTVVEGEVVVVVVGVVVEMVVVVVVEVVVVEVVVVVVVVVAPPQSTSPAKVPP